MDAHGANSINSSIPEFESLFKERSALRADDASAVLVEGALHNGLRLRLNATQMRLIHKALRVQLVYVLRAGRTRREPTAVRRHLEPSDWGAVADGGRRKADDALAGELRRRDIAW